MTVGHVRLPLLLRACTLSRRLHGREPLRPWRSPVQSAPPFTLPCFVTVPNAATCCALRLAESPPRSNLLPTSQVLAGSSPCYGWWWSSRPACSADSGCTAVDGPGLPAPWACPGLRACQTTVLSHRLR